MCSFACVFQPTIQEIRIQICEGPIITDFEHKEMTQTWRTENLIDYILKDLEKRVKKDKPTKLSVFFTGLSTYLHNPNNLFLKGESGVGKTYNVTETLQYFPQEDIWFLGGLSPKALIHGYGVLLNKHGESIDLLDKPAKPKKRKEQSEEDHEQALERHKDDMKAWREEMKNSYTLIDLSHKILVFLEAPEYSTFHMLFPILSHDTERIEYRFTDKKEGRLRTSKVIIQGWPATVFLSTDKKYIEELATRSFTATPGASTEKIEAANILTNLKVSYPWQYNHETKETEVIKTLVSSVRTRFLDEKIGVIIPFPNLHDDFPKEIVRDMRDFQHFTQLLKTITALHFYQRPLTKIDDKKFLIAAIQDVKEALQIYNEIFETTRTGTEKRILSFYHDIVKKGDLRYLKQLTVAYNEKHEKKASSETIRQKLQRLSEIGYVNIQKDDEDKRLNVYIPLMKDEEISKISQVLETWTISRFKLEEGFKNWVKTILQTTPFYYYKNLSEGTWGEAEINIKEATQLILKDVSDEKLFPITNEGTCRIVSKQVSDVKTEKKLENIHNSKTCVILDNSETSPSLKNRTSSHTELAMLGKDSVPSGPVPLTQKKKIAPEGNEIDNMFSEYVILEQELRKEWTKAFKKETQATEFVALIRKHRPDWNRDKVMDFFSKLIDDKKLWYVNDEGKPTSEKENGWLVWQGEMK